MSGWLATTVTNKEYPKSDPVKQTHQATRYLENWPAITERNNIGASQYRTHREGSRFVHGVGESDQGEMGTSHVIC